MLNTNVETASNNIRHAPRMYSNTDIYRGILITIITVSVIALSPYHDWIMWLVIGLLITACTMVITLYTSVLKDGKRQQKKLATQARLIEDYQQRLQEAQESMQGVSESNKQLAHFAAIASHELQAPLRTIYSFSQILQNKLAHKLSETEQKDLALIYTTASGMKELVSSLLNYAKLTNHTLNKTDISLPDLLRNIRFQFQTDLQEKEAQIYLEKIPESISGDHTQIRQVFHNLIGNALKFSSPDRTPVITLSCEENQEEWCFSICDNGIGMDTKYRDKIFQLFSRLHTRTQYEGTGIGLALCKKMVEQHEGRIWCESTEGEGSTFYFTIPKEIRSCKLLREAV